MQQLTKDFLGSDASYWHPAHFSSPETRLPGFGQTADDGRLIDQINRSIKASATTKIDTKLLTELFAKSSLPQRFLRLFIILYSADHDRVVVSRSNEQGEWSFSRVFERLLNHPRRLQLSAQNYHVQLDFMEAPSSPADFYELSMEQRGAQHFELGIDGISLYDDSGSTRHFLPGDAYVRSITSTDQFRAYAHHAFGNESLKDSPLKRFRTSSFLVTGGSIHRLYRGVPAVGELSKEKLEECAHCTIEHITLTQHRSGKFLHFYDPVKDTNTAPVDIAHDERGYGQYNLRHHCGGALACLCYEKYTGNGAVIGNVVRAIEYFLDRAVFYEMDGRMAASVCSRGSSPYGAAGIGLYLLATYEGLTADSKFRKAADALAWHIINQVSGSGELAGVRLFDEKRATRTDSLNQIVPDCPGEAICGLASYLPYLSATEQTDYLDKIRTALEFLNSDPSKCVIRCGQEASFACWLSTGIVALWDFTGMRKERYANLVFCLAKKSIDKMYRVTDAPYPDYAGGFYGQYGDYPSGNGARMQGLMSAYELACKMDSREIMRELWQAIRLGAWSMMHLINTRQAMYSSQQPEIAVGGVRHTITGQSFGIATAHHVAAFYSRILPYWNESNEGIDAPSAAPLQKGHGK